MTVRFNKGNPFNGFKITKQRSKDAMDWFSGAIESLSDTDKQRERKIADTPVDGNADVKPQEIKQKDNIPKGLQPGSLYLQSYDAKHKATLPVWDQLPLFFLLKFLPDGYLGLNLHYLPMGVRIGILGTLTDYTNNKKIDDNTRLRMSWSLINSVSKLEPLQECIKHYLFSHVTSTPVYITPSNWEFTASLPMEKWVYNKDKNKK